MKAPDLVLSPVVGLDTEDRLLRWNENDLPRERRSVEALEKADEHRFSSSNPDNDLSILSLRWLPT